MNLVERKKSMKKIIGRIINHSIMDDEKTPIVQTRIEKYEKKIQKIDTFLMKNKQRIGARKKEVKSNITDNESAKLKSNHGIIQGYNALAAVDSKHQVIVSAKAVGTQGEGSYLKSLIEDAKGVLPKKITKQTTILALYGLSAIVP